MFLTKWGVNGNIPMKVGQYGVQLKNSNLTKWGLQLILCKGTLDKEAPE